MQKNNNILFIPLGGGQRVGASCYFLRLGETNILLDAGTGTNGGIICNPVFSSLMSLPGFCSMNQIDHIFISHAHIDHCGYLFNIMSEAIQANVYMTDITKSLIELQIFDRKLSEKGSYSQQRRLSAQNKLDRITTVSFMKSMHFEKFNVTFYPAGHIPGAMMTLFEFNGKNILYTGDYSIDASPLTQGCIIPDKRIDVLIMCGLHAKHPNYTKKSDTVFSMIKIAFGKVRKGFSVQFSVSQLSKGIEFLQMINKNNTDHIPIYIGPRIMQVVEKMEKNGVRIISPDNRQMLGVPPSFPHIYITESPRANPIYYPEKMDINFTLHEDFSQMTQFISTIDPRQVFIVHAAKAYNLNDMTIEQKIMLDSDCKAQFTFAEEQEIYKL